MFFIPGIATVACKLLLKKNEELRVLAGHPWVFSNEIREIIGKPAAGEIVELRTAGGIALGIGMYHPNSLIAFRLLGATPVEIDTQFFCSRLTRAAELRTHLFPGESSYRLVHGESDFLPGLVIDRYNSLLVIQTFAQGMDMRLDIICDALEQLFHPSGIIERNESPLRTLENLPLRSGVLRGTAEPVEILEHGLRYRVDVLAGQKTGFFLDQRMNRLAIRPFSPGARVLDCFCNDGGFALHAAAAGALSVLGIDSSVDAVSRARENATLNGLASVRFVEADVFKSLNTFAEQEEPFNVVVLDPPSFTRSRKNVPAAKKGYRDLHAAAMKVLAPGGMLLTASCSHHILPETFLEIVNETGRAQKRDIQLVEWRGASPDHPTLPAVPETSYLKFGVFRVF
jgi:23S rRNA (cytosine1962-C5)-methyltransferase